MQGKFRNTPPGEIPAKVLRWTLRRMKNTVNEWWARAGGLEIKPSELLSLVSRHSLSAHDAAMSVLSTMADLSGVDSDTLKTLRSDFPREIEELLSDADRLAQKIFTILGREIDFSGGIDLHLDPRHNHRFDPAEYYANIAHSSPSGGFDIKYPWELSRLQHLPRLAMAYRLTHEQRYLDAMADQTSDWIDRNPVGFGPNWACTMDVSIRAANMALAFAIAGDYAWGSQLAIDLVRNLISHGRFIVNNLEWYDRLTSNHYLADIAGLAMLGCLLGPVVFEAGNWRKFAHDELEFEINKQVYDDGWDFEASTSYHRLALECFFVPAVFLERSGLEMSDSYKNRLSLMAKFIRDISVSEGSFPLIGDNDSGRFIELFPRKAENVNYLLGLSAAYFNDNSLKPPGLGPSPEIPILLGTKSLSRFINLRATDKPSTSEYPQGGLWCLRSEDGLDLLTFRLGQVGQKGNGGHAHNDQLSITVWFGSKPIIVDPGTACYTSDPAKRNLFRSTSMHSTIAIGDEEQNAFIDGNLFTLPQKVKFDAAGIRSDESGISIDGAILGYGKWSEKEVAIRRRIRFVSGQRQFEIEDRIEIAPSLRDFPVRWDLPVAPGLKVEASPWPCRFIDEQGAEVADMLFFPGWKVEILSSMFAPGYGVEISNVILRFTPPSGTGRGTICHSSQSKISCYMKAIICEYHSWNSITRIGNHHYADRFLKSGWDVLWISHPVSPFHGFKKGNKERISRAKSGPTQHPDGPVEIVPFTLLPFYNAPILRSRWTLANSHNYMSPSLARLIDRAGFPIPTFSGSPTRCCIFFPTLSAQESLP